MKQNACFPPNSLHQLLQNNVTAQRSCHAASVTAMKDKLVRFQNLRKGLEASRLEFEKDTEWEDWVNSGLMATRWIKASCDAFISMAATGYDQLVGKGPLKVGELTKSGYTLFSSVAEASAVAANGQKVDTVGLMRDAKDGMMGMVGAAGHFDAGAGRVSGVANLYVNIGIDAVRKDDARVMEQATAGQLSELSKLTASWAKDLKQVGAEKAAERLGAVADIMGAAYAFDVALTKAGDEYIASQEDTVQRRRSLRRTFRNQLAQLDEKIKSLEASIDSCFVPADRLSSQPEDEVLSSQPI